MSKPKFRAGQKVSHVSFEEPCLIITVNSVTLIGAVEIYHHYRLQLNGNTDSDIIHSKESHLSVYVDADELNLTIELLANL